jgi:hypothetical protein
MKLEDVNKCTDVKYKTYADVLTYIMETGDLMGVSSMLEDAEIDEEYCKCAGIKSALDLIDTLKVMIEISHYGKEEKT